MLPGRPAEEVIVDAGTGKVLWNFDVAAHSQAHPQLISSPAVLTAEGSPGPRIYFGSELKGPVSSAAVVTATDPK